MTEVPVDEIKVNITLGHVGRHCILHALTVIEAAISQVCSSVCVCVSVSVCMCLCVCPYLSALKQACIHTCVCMCVHVHAYIHIITVNTA